MPASKKLNINKISKPQGLRLNPRLTAGLLPEPSAEPDFANFPIEIQRQLVSNFKHRKIIDACGKAMADPYCRRSRFSALRELSRYFQDDPSIVRTLCSLAGSEKLNWPWKIFIEPREDDQIAYGFNRDLVRDAHYIRIVSVTHEVLARVKAGRTVAKAIEEIADCQLRFPNTKHPLRRSLLGEKSLRTAFHEGRKYIENTGSLLTMLHGIPKRLYSGISLADYTRGDLPSPGRPKTG